MLCRKPKTGRKQSQSSEADYTKKCRYEAAKRKRRETGENNSGTWKRRSEGENNPEFRKKRDEAGSEHGGVKSARRVETNMEVVRKRGYEVKLKEISE